jgi:hypothetical protein
MADTSSGARRSSTKKSSKKTAKREHGAKHKDKRSSEGVLANLPRTRPQRSSARRDAARRTASVKVGPTGAPARKAPSIISTRAEPAPTRKRAATKTKAAAVKRGQGTTKPKSPAKRLQDRAPRQGFETEGDPLSGPVQPPGSVDLLSSAAELAGELTKSGLSTGGRLLKDFLGRLPLN